MLKKGAIKILIALNYEDFRNLFQEGQGQEKHIRREKEKMGEKKSWLHIQRIRTPNILK